MKFKPKKLGRAAELSNPRSTPLEWFTNIILVGLVFYIFYLILGWSAEYIAVNIPDSWESKIAINLEAQEITDPNAPRAERVFEKLRTYPGLRPLPYKLEIIDMKMPNAFAMPGGTIGVTSGLLDLVRRESGLAMVMAHEFGHHYFRHTLRRMGRGLLFALFSGLAFGENISQVSSSIFEVSELSFNRDQERQADRFGLRMVKDIYGSTEGSLEFFEEMLASGKEKDSVWSQWTSTHPNSKERIYYLKDLARSWDDNSGIED